MPWLEPHVYRFPSGGFHTSMPLQRLFPSLGILFHFSPFLGLVGCMPFKLRSSLFPGESLCCLLCSYHFECSLIAVPDYH